MTKTVELARRLRQAVEDVSPLLQKVTEEDADARHRGGEGWSRKQELGHLIDSATNNRVRFVRAGLEGTFIGPSYDGIGWVRLGGYAQMSWSGIVAMWTQLNVALSTVIENIGDDRLNASCRIGSADPVTLQFLIDDYILHMKHHLDHVLGHEELTSYPGAKLAI